MPPWHVAPNTRIGIKFTDNTPMRARLKFTSFQLTALLASKNFMSM